MRMHIPAMKGAHSMLDVFFYVFAIICLWLSICFMIYGKRSKGPSNPSGAAEECQTRGDE